MITVLLSIVFLVLQGFGMNIIQDWQAMLWAGVLEISVEFFYVCCLQVGDYKMKIQELLPHLKKGWVAMDKDKHWWYSEEEIQPISVMGCWATVAGRYCLSLCLSKIFDLEPFDGDWKDSLMKCGGNSIKWNSKDIMPHPKDTHHIITKSGFEYQWLPTRDWKNPKNNGWYSYETDKMFVDCPEDWMDYDVWKKSLFMKCGEKK